MQIPVCKVAEVVAKARGTTPPGDRLGVLSSDGHRVGTTGPDRRLKDTLGASFDCSPMSIADRVGLIDNCGQPTSYRLGLFVFSLDAQLAIFCARLSCFNDLRQALWGLRDDQVIFKQIRAHPQIDLDRLVCTLVLPIASGW